MERKYHAELVSARFCAARAFLKKRYGRFLHETGGNHRFQQFSSIFGRFWTSKHNEQDFKPRQKWSSIYCELYLAFCAVSVRLRMAKYVFWATPAPNSQNICTITPHRFFALSDLREWKLVPHDTAFH